MSSGIIGIATSGLLSYQRSLQTISHNISNVDTEGFSRQRTDLAASTPFYTGYGYAGTGVQIGDIRRTYDDFLTNQVRNNSSLEGMSSAYDSLATQVDGFLADESVSVGPSLQGLFNATQAVATDPTSIPARQTMLSEAGNLSSRFKAVADRLNDIRVETKSQLTNVVSQVNSYAKSIAALNVNIQSQTASGKLPNDLLDQRDLLIQQLSKKVNVTTVTNTNGFVDVIVGSGLSLVLGATANKLQVQQSVYGEPNDADIALVSNLSTDVVTKRITGGEVAGILNFREQLLDPAQNAVGRIAAGLATDFNAQHIKGYDLNGVVGGNFFSAVPNAAVYAATTNNVAASTPTVTIGSTTNLTTSDYRMDIVGGQYQITDMQTNTVVSPLAAVPAAGVPINFNGLVITNPAAYIAGDSFTIRPTRLVAGQMNVLITDPRKIAAAGGVPPAAFSGVGDNSNAKALSGLQNSLKLIGNSASYQDAFGAMVSTMGVGVSTNKSNNDAHQRMLAYSQQAQQQVSGVNMDEEAANLIQFQQAYQASAQVVSTANNLFNVLIGAVRG